MNRQSAKGLVSVYVRPACVALTWLAVGCGLHDAGGRHDQTDAGLTSTAEDARAVRRALHGESLLLPRTARVAGTGQR